VKVTVVAPKREKLKRQNERKRRDRPNRPDKPDRPENPSVNSVDLTPHLLGLGVADAAHVAFAEYSGAEFITCDTKLLKKCETSKIKIWCGNPVAFCEKEGLR
jgi:predicted nucleic acid-binding protein